MKNLAYTSAAPRGLAPRGRWSLCPQHIEGKMGIERKMQRFILTFAVLAASSLALSPIARADGDAAAGKALFQQKCALCHSPEKGVNKLGPSLWNVVGQPAAEVPNFSFSPGMKSAHITWDDASLDKWLTNPRAMVPGTKMVFVGLPNEQDRQNVIAYLKTLK